MKHFVIIFLGITLIASKTSAASTNTLDAASVGMAFSGRLASARTAPLGSGFTAMADDSSAMLWNPAGLSIIKRGQIGLHHQTWVGGVLQETVLFALPTKKFGGLGVLANYVNYGVFQGRDSQGNPTRALGASDLGLGIGWGRQLAGPIHAGFTFRRQQQTLADASYETYTADLGLLARFSPKLSLGASFMNFGTQLGDSQSAMSLRIGGAWTPDLPNRMKSTFSFGYSKENKARDRLNVGFEFYMNSLVILRGGYEYFLGNTLGLEGITGVVLGFGLNVNSIGLDYAFVPMGVLGNAHRVSLVYSFDPSPAIPRAAMQISPVIPVKVVRLPESVPRRIEAVAPLPTPTPHLKFRVNSASVFLDKAANLSAQKKYREAIAAYNQAIQREPKNTKAWRGLGNLYFKLKRKAFALQCFEEVLRLQPQDERLRFWLLEYKNAP